MTAVQSLRRFAVWPSALVALGLAFALVPWAQGKLFFYWDNAKQHYAQTQFLHESIRAGSLPQWWPAAGMGVPVTAEGQAAHYSPVRLLLAMLLSPSGALMWEVGVYLAIAGLGTYLFLRQLQVSRQGSAIGGVCQMFGSFSIIFVRNVALHRAMCLLPFAMYFAERFVQRRRPRDLLGAALTLALQFLSGHPTLAVVTVVASSVYVAARDLQRWSHRSRPLVTAGYRLGRTLSAWGLAVALGLGMSAVQTIPTLMHVHESLRDGGLTFDHAARLPATPRGLTMALLPYVHPQGDWAADRRVPGQDVNTTAIAGLYSGTLPIVLALLAALW